MAGPEPGTRSLGMTLLLLGRVSNLPTVWSNCLAAFVLGGGTGVEQGAWLMLGATLLYLGGMYLNDAFDAAYDRRYRQERPIPAGDIGERAVWLGGSAFLGLGFVTLTFWAQASVSLAILLVTSILVYDAVHKLLAWSPLLMALCRLVLFLTAASAGDSQIDGFVLWCALALFFYVVGLSFVARHESSGGVVLHWPSLFLLAPALLALVVNDGVYRWAGWVTIIAYLFWVAFSLSHLYWTTRPNIGKTVSLLLAGIVLVDLMALGMQGVVLSVAMLGMLLAALLMQKYVPAT